MGTIIKSYTIGKLGPMMPFCIHKWLPPEFEVLNVLVEDSYLKLLIQFDSANQFEEIDTHFHIALDGREFFADSWKYLGTYRDGDERFLVLQIMEGDWGVNSQEFKSRFGDDEYTESRYSDYLSEVKAKLEAMNQREQEALAKDLDAMEAYVKEVLKLLGIDPDEPVNPTLN